MKFFADLHIHSHYSRATSKNLNFEHLSKWAQLKGITVVGTGDIAHPGWLQEMRDKLEPAEEGLFKLKDEFVAAIRSEVPAACQAPVRFMLAGEISSIYKKNDKVRKVHNVIFAPSLGAVEKIQAALEKIGNIRSDGRPILGLDSRDLLEIILDIDPQDYLIPAHIWTPWFSLLGSKSGFDSVAECFDDLTPHIFALETGLSSDPPMNWRISALDGYTLISNSDAHSPQKLAREANLFNTELSYPSIFEALKSGDPASFLGTTEFFPEEGKYHYDGHRKCGIRWEPETTIEHNMLCAVCGKPVTVGVMHRVETLADRQVGAQPARPQRYQSLIPLPEILSEVHQVGPTSKRVKRAYDRLLLKLGSELTILRDLPVEDIERVGGVVLAEGIRRMRRGEISIAAGFDGEFGVIKLFGDQEREKISSQMSFIEAPTGPAASKRRSRPMDLGRPQAEESGETDTTNHESIQASEQWAQEALFDQPDPTVRSRPEIAQNSVEAVLLTDLNPQQREAASCTDVPLIIVAGPGTGKTRTLTYRIAYLIKNRVVAPATILAITFTNKATEEMAHRLEVLLDPEAARSITIKTFHALGAMILRESAEQSGLDPHFSICSEQDRKTVLKQIYPDFSDKHINQLLDQISTAKNQRSGPASSQASETYPFEPDFESIYHNYNSTLRQNRLLDFDDLILQPADLFDSSPEVLDHYRNRFRWISVDEYQDINAAQYRLLRQLAGPVNNLCAIGDPDQAVYGFRGADRKYFLTFQQDFPTAKTMRLDQNYRSTQLILDASGQVIAQDEALERLKIWSEVVDRTKLDVHQAPTHQAEAEYIVHQIESLVGGTSYFSIDSGRVEDETIAGRSFADFAILYRLGIQSQPLIEAFERSGIPYQTVGQTPLIEHKEIKQILAYLWFAQNPGSRFYLDQILNSTEIVDAVLAPINEDGPTLWEALQTFEQRGDLTGAQTRQLRNLVPFLQELRQLQGSHPVAGLIELIHTFISDHNSGTSAREPSERVKRFMLSATPYGNKLESFLESTVLLRETDAYDPRADRVTLMTLHAAKGLEFPVVFIAGCEDELIPYQKQGEQTDFDEERRLFYVGMTRAQQKLILTHARTRFLFGQKLNGKPSRFLQDIETALIQTRLATQKVSNKKVGSRQLKLF